MTVGSIPRQRGFTLIELLIVLVVMAILIAIVIPMFLSQRAKAKDADTKSGVRTIEVGIMAYALDHSDTYPPVLDSQADLVDESGNPYVDSWPTNSWRGEPMKSDPSAKGDYTYTLTGDSFTLVGHLSAGEFALP